MKHKSVLLQETIDGLNVTDNGIYLDGTLGSGGHTFAICEKAKDITVIGIDADKDAIKRSEEKLKDLDCKTILEISPNHKLDEVLDKHSISKINGAIFDYGLSSDQLEDSGRGFSFQKNEPLLMTMKENPSESDLTAEEIVNQWALESITSILEGYGEEKYAYRIAKAIIEAREEEKIKTTFQLVKIIEDAVPKFYLRKRINPATKTFQALRITVNNEIEHIKISLQKAFDRLAPEGRLVIISFHSIEDRVVKHTFRKWSDEGIGALLTKKPITPGENEVIENPRARSAKLRIIQKI